MAISPHPRVLVDRHLWTRPEDWERLARTVEPVEPEGEEPLTEAQLLTALEGCQGLIRLGGRLPEVTRKVIEGAPELRIVGVRGDRFGYGIDLEAAWERGIMVVDTDNISSAGPVAEWDLALILL